MEGLFVVGLKIGWLEEIFVVLRGSVDESRSIGGALLEHCWSIVGALLEHPRSMQGACKEHILGECRAVRHLVVRRRTACGLSWGS